MFLSKRTQGIFDRFMPVTNATNFTNYVLSLALYHCTMLLSPCKNGNREFDSDYHHRPHFPAVSLFQTEIFGDFLAAFE